jgi:ribosomal protein S27E
VFRDRDLEHPDITRALKTGYPTEQELDHYYCDECGECLDDQTMYEDSTHKYLCKECLLILHEKSQDWW